MEYLSLCWAKVKAEKVGFQPGDIIVQIEDVEIKNFTNVEAALRNIITNTKEFM